MLQGPGHSHIIYVLVCFSVGVIEFWSKSPWGGKGLFHITEYSPSLREAGVRSQAGPWRQELEETTEECGSLTCSRITISYPSCAAQADPPRDGTCHSDLCPPTSVINKENVPKAIWRKKFLSWRALFPGMSSWQPIWATIMTSIVTLS